MKGYYTPSGYMGYVPMMNKYLLFATETDYVEWFAEYEKMVNIAMERSIG